MRPVHNVLFHKDAIVLEFGILFCQKNGAIDWEKLVKFVSEDDSAIER